MRTVTRVEWMLMLVLTAFVLNPERSSAAETRATEAPSDAPSLELLDFLGLMVESAEGELIGPETLGDDTTADAAVRDQWISRDAPASGPGIDDSPTRRWSQDNLFEKESIDE